MESANLNRTELKNLIFYGIKENGIDIKDINDLEINFILSDYDMFCNHFQLNYVIGELDTFKRAACLMVSINRGRLVHNKKINASIAVDAAHKMCENPYWNIGENFDIPKKLEEVDFKEVFKKDIDAYNTSRNMIIDSLLYERSYPINYNLNLELFYQVALLLKHKEDKKVEVIDEQIQEETKSNKVLSLFKKKFNNK